MPRPGGLDDGVADARAAHASGVDRSDVVAAVNELADRRLVQRTPDPDDRRRNIIAITPAGTEQLQKLHPVLADVREMLLAPLSPPDRAQLIALLNRLLEHDAQR